VKEHLFGKLLVQLFRRLHSAHGEHLPTFRI
jgi:hypothetical protein